MKYPLAMLDSAGNHIDERAAQFILSLAPKVKVQWVDIEDMFVDDKIGRSYYHTRQLQLNESMALSIASGQYKLYTDIAYPASLQFVNCPIIESPDTDHLLYRHDITSYAPPEGFEILAIPKPVFTPNKPLMQAEVIKKGYFTDDVGQRWYVPDMTQAKEILSLAIRSDLPALKLALDRKLPLVAIPPTEIFYLDPKK